MTKLSQLVLVAILGGCTAMSRDGSEYHVGRPTSMSVSGSGIFAPLAAETARHLDPENIVRDQGRRCSEHASFDERRDSYYGSRISLNYSKSCYRTSESSDRRAAR
jgi:hypothetical protein